MGRVTNDKIHKNRRKKNHQFGAVIELLIIFQKYVIIIVYITVGVSVGPSHDL